MNQEDSANHVISDVQAEGSSCVVDEGRIFDGEGGNTDVQHVVDLGRQGKGCGGKRRLLMLPDVVEFTLKDKETAETEHLQRNHDCIFLNNQAAEVGSSRVQILLLLYLSTFVWYQYFTPLLIFLTTFYILNTNTCTFYFLHVEHKYL